MDKKRKGPTNSRWHLLILDRQTAIQDKEFEFKNGRDKLGWIGMSQSKTRLMPFMLQCSDYYYHRLFLLFEIGTLSPN